MLRLLLGAIVSLVGLVIVGVAVSEFFDAVTIGFDYTGLAMWVIKTAGYDYFGPIAIVSVAFLGGILFVGGCLIAGPVTKKPQPAK